MEIYGIIYSTGYKISQFTVFTRSAPWVLTVLLKFYTCGKGGKYGEKD